MSGNYKNFSTKAIHVGSEPDKETGAVMPPIFQTSTYVQKSPGVHQGYEYTRSHNPTRTRLEQCLASLEDSKFAMVTSSGLSAEMLIMHSLPKGSTILCGDDLYGGSYRLFTSVFNEFHNFLFVDTTDLQKVEEIFKANKIDVFWLESPTNPLLKITDIEQAATLAKKYDAKSVVDNTFMSPYFQTPLALGADLVVHSTTKYINGHSDVVGGALMLNDKEWYDKLWYLHNAIGPQQSPFDSWLILRGVKTLALRMKQIETNAIELAGWLENHSKIESVLYPGLSSHPQHAIAKKQTNGFGGIITIFIKGDIEKSKSVLEKMKIFALAESLGGVESLIEHPAIMTHASVPKDVREAIGLTDNLIRLSVGIEDVEDLRNDLDQALNIL